MERRAQSMASKNHISSIALAIAVLLSAASSFGMAPLSAFAKEKASTSTHESTKKSGSTTVSTTETKLTTKTESKDSAASSTEGKADDKAKVESSETAEQAFQAYRADQLKSIETSANSGRDTFGVKLAKAVLPTFREGYSLPLTLQNSQTVDGATELTYVATDKNVDCKLKVTMQKVKGKWTVTNQVLNGSYFNELGQKSVSNISSAVPGECALIIGGLLLAGLSFLILNIGSIWLIVVAFQTSIVWGLCTLFLPFASLVFAVMHWSRAKKPMIVMISAGVGMTIGICIDAGMIVSAADFNPSTPKKFMD